MEQGQRVRVQDKIKGLGKRTMVKSQGQRVKDQGQRVKDQGQVKGGSHGSGLGLPGKHLHCLQVSRATILLMMWPRAVTLAAAAA